mgnify:CR=1 FL=1
MAIAAVVSPAVAIADINGAGAKAYFERGVAMYADKNYNGCTISDTAIYNTLCINQ